MKLGSCMLLPERTRPGLFSGSLCWNPGEHRKNMNKPSDLEKLLSKPKRLSEAILAGTDARKEVHGKLFGLAIRTKTHAPKMDWQAALQRCHKEGVAVFSRGGSAIRLSQAGKQPGLVHFKPYFKPSACRVPSSPTFRLAYKLP